MARNLLAIHNLQAWGELANLMPKDFGKTPPVTQPEGIALPPTVTQEQQELTCIKSRRIKELEAELAKLKSRTVQWKE